MLLRKLQLVSAFILILIGTNIFTYATTRYKVTEHVLTRAEDRMEAALRNIGLFEDAYNNGGAAFLLAIPLAGGRYYWWNDGLIWWGCGLFTFSIGALLPFAHRQVTPTATS